MAKITNLKLADFMMASNAQKVSSVFKIKGYQNKFFDRIEYVKANEGIKLNTMFTYSPGTFFGCSALRVWTPENDEFRGYYFINTTPVGGQGPNHDQFYELGDGNTFNPDFTDCVWTKALEIDGTTPYSGTDIFTISFARDPESTATGKWQLKKNSTVISEYDITPYVGSTSLINEYNPYRPISGNYSVINQTNKKYFPLIAWSMATGPAEDAFTVIVRMSNTSNNNIYGFTPYFSTGNLKVDWGDGYKETLDSSIKGKVLTHTYTLNNPDPTTNTQEFVIRVILPQGGANLSHIVFGYNTNLLEPWREVSVAQEALGEGSRTYWETATFKGNYTGGTNYSTTDIVNLTSNNTWYRPLVANPSGAPSGDGNAQWQKLVKYDVELYGTDPRKAREENTGSTYAFLDYGYNCVVIPASGSGDPTYYIMKIGDAGLPTNFVNYASKVISSNWKWSALGNSCSNADLMFNKCTNLVTDAYNTSTYTSDDSANLTELYSIFTTANAMYGSCSNAGATFNKIQGLPSPLVYANYMFDACTSGTFATLAGIPANTTQAHSMFDEDSAATFAALVNAGSGVVDGSRMFNSCTTTTFPVLTSISTVMTLGYEMFYDCNKAIFGSSFPLSNYLINGNSMFYKCGYSASNNGNKLEITHLPGALTVADHMFEMFGGTIYLGDDDPSHTDGLDANTPPSN